MIDAAWQIIFWIVSILISVSGVIAACAFITEIRL